MSTKAYEKIERLRRRKSGKKRERDKEIEAWRKKYREAGPVEFSKILPSFPDTPIHPELGRRPEFIMLSPDQAEFLVDLWKGIAKLALVVAGRGAGKTAALAVWNCWRLTCFDYYTITCMGGSQEQSTIIQSYIDFWRDTVPEVRYCIPRSTKGGKTSPRCFGKQGSLVRFPPCSSTAARGPHVNEVQIDEACAAEAKSKDGVKAVDAAWWQIIGKGEDTILIMLSTAHYVFGKFYDYLTEPKKYGFRVYRWAIAKHISGKKPEATYKDRNPNNWVPAVWWVTQDKIITLRKAKSDEEWLCEALGGISLASGAVFNHEDLGLAFCDICPECDPYKWDTCELVRKLKLGTEINPTKYIIDRKAGYDYGAKAPNALTIAGKKGNMIFILLNEELKGVRDEEIIDWLDTNLREWRCYTINPDPSAAGYIISQKLEDKGFTVNLLDEGGKTERIFNVKKFMERHLFVIPKAYWNLTRSLKKAAYDDKGKVRKTDDHSFDTLCYACVDWIAEGSSPDEFFKLILGEKAVRLSPDEGRRLSVGKQITPINIWGKPRKTLRPLRKKKRIDIGKLAKEDREVIERFQKNYRICPECKTKNHVSKRTCIKCGERIKKPIID